MHKAGATMRIRRGVDILNYEIVQEQAARQSSAAPWKLGSSSTAEPELACSAGAESANAAFRIAETCTSVSLSITVGVSMRQSKTCVFTAIGWPLGC
jgi:hypothetical protein